MLQLLTGYSNYFTAENRDYYDEVGSPIIGTFVQYKRSQREERLKVARLKAGLSPDPRPMTRALNENEKILKEVIAITDDEVPLAVLDSARIQRQKIKEEKNSVTNQFFEYLAAQRQSRTEAVCSDPVEESPAPLRTVSTRAQLRSEEVPSEARPTSNESNTNVEVELSASEKEHKNDENPNSAELNPMLRKALHPLEQKEADLNEAMAVLTDTAEKKMIYDYGGMLSLHFLYFRGREIEPELQYKRSLLSEKWSSAPHTYFAANVCFFTFRSAVDALAAFRLLLVVGLIIILSVASAKLDIHYPLEMHSQEGKERDSDNILTSNAPSRAIGKEIEEDFRWGAIFMPVWLLFGLYIAGQIFALYRMVELMYSRHHLPSSQLPVPQVETHEPVMDGDVEQAEEGPVPSVVKEYLWKDYRWVTLLLPWMLLSFLILICIQLTWIDDRRRKKLIVATSVFNSSVYQRAMQDLHESSDPPFTWLETTIPLWMFLITRGILKIIHLYTNFKEIIDAPTLDPSEKNVEECGKTELLVWLGLTEFLGHTVCPLVMVSVLSGYFYDLQKSGSGSRGAMDMNWYGFFTPIYVWLLIWLCTNLPVAIARRCRYINDKLDKQFVVHQGGLRRFLAFFWSMIHLVIKHLLFFAAFFISAILLAMKLTDHTQWSFGTVVSPMIVLLCYALIPSVFVCIRLCSLHHWCPNAHYVVFGHPPGIFFADNGWDSELSQ